MYKLKYWFYSRKGKSFLIILILFVFASLIIIPMLFYVFFSEEINIYAYNRDANSGTREAFEEAIKFEDGQKYSGNVFEVSGNDTMIKNVSNTENSIGYISYSTAFNDQGELIDGIDVLGFEETTKDEILNDFDIENYEAKRPFNLFFRIDAEEAPFFSENIFPGENYQSTIWGSEYDQKAYDQIVIENDRQARLAVSFLFYNWVLFSKEAQDLLEFGYQDNGEQYYQFHNVDDTGEEIFMNYSQNTGLSDYLEKIDNSKEDPLKIQTQGSTSVLNTLNLLMDDPTEGFIEECEENGIYITHEPLHTGSSDAFKPDVIGSSDVFLGFQSRSPSLSEIQGWGYEVSEDQLPSDGFYSRTSYQDYDDLLYSSFETDAILFIINENVKYQDQNGSTKHPQWINQKGLNLIYGNNFAWETLDSLGDVS